MITLSKRLQAVCDMVPPGRRICDVGCDHAHVDIRLLQEGTITSALAMDVAPGPLARARENLELTGLTDRCETRISDGLSAYEPGEADTMICTGMGGMLMRSILDAGAEKTAGFRELILSPQREPELVREWLGQAGYVIADEVFLEDAGQYYTVMLVRSPESCDASSCGLSDADWEAMARNVRSLSDDQVQKGMIDRQQVLTLLEDTSFRRCAENRYGPCVLRRFLRGAGRSGEETEAGENSRSAFLQFTKKELRQKLQLAEQLSSQTDRENVQYRMQQICGEIGILQVLLFLYQMEMEMPELCCP